MDGRRFFDANLDDIGRAIALVCRQVRLHGTDAQDFASDAHVALLADDCAILRKYQGRSSVTSYVAVVLRRLFVDQKRANGRWHASAEAVRGGDAAMLIERLLIHEQMPLTDALALTTAQHPDAGIAALEAIAAALPVRAPRVRITPISEADEERLAGRSRSDERAAANDLERTRARASSAVRAAFGAMSAEDRVILRLRFVKDVAVSDIARSLGLQQRPLYRRIETLLARLRAALETAGVTAGDAADLVGTAAGDGLDFMLEERKTAEIPPSIETETQ
jgi:RNA polymerase sigma factor for flagellar operon FliA